MVKISDAIGAKNQEGLGLGLGKVMWMLEVLKFCRNHGKDFKNQPRWRLTSCISVKEIL